MAAASIRVVKQFVYRGQTREFSNRYHFTGSAPTNSTLWATFSDNIVLAEEACFMAPISGGCEIVATFGYAGGSDVPVYTKTYTEPGTASFTSWSPLPGDCAAVARYGTADRSSKNHPVYCFNYYHSISAVAGAGNQDELHAAQKSALLTYCDTWVTGFSDGVVNHIRSRPSGDAVTGVSIEALVSHRDLPR